MNTYGTWTPLHATALDLTVSAQVGDLLEYTINGSMDNGGSSESFDVVNVTSSIFWASGTTTALTYGHMGWRCQTSVEASIQGAVTYTVVAGDISAGLVKCRLHYRSDSSNARTVYGGGTAGTMLYVSLRNLGPVLP